MGGNNGQLPNGGHVGGALELDGVDDYVDIVGYKGIMGTQPRTITAWIKTTSTASYNPIVHWGDNVGGVDSAGDRWTFTTNHDGGINYLRIMIQGDYFRIETPTINNGQWHHVAVTWQDDGTPDCDDAILYYDGVAYATGDDTSAITVNTTPDEDVTIGKWMSYYFDGLIDDVRIYNRPLSQSEITVLATE